MSDRALTPADDINHEADEDCPCGPTPMFVNGGVIYVHHSLDNRENSEVKHGTG